MNLKAPISTIMTADVITISPKDKLLEAKKIFDKKRLHHIPVTEEDKVVGMISMTDLLYFLKGKSNDSYEEVLNEVRLKNYTVEEIMSTGLAELSPDDPISAALNIFKVNLFHALPIVDNDKLVGIISTQDIIVTLANQEVLN